MSDHITGRWLDAAELGQVTEALAAVRSALMCHEPLTERLDIAIYAALALLRPAADDRQAALERAIDLLIADVERECIKTRPSKQALRVATARAVKVLARLAASGERA